MTPSDLHQRLLHQLDRVKALNTHGANSLPQKAHASRSADANAAHPHIPAVNDGKSRNEHREQVQRTGSISYMGGDLNVQCQISDLTSSGARLSIADDVTVPSCFDLRILPDNTMKKAQVCWRNNQELGIQFIQQG